jgi:EAL domain-containing protein (putative c-di-GMP-specific phosphodiesterase class I)
MDRLTTELLGLVPAAQAAAVGLLGDDDRVVFVHTSGLLEHFVGVSVERTASISGLALASATVQRCDDAASDARVDRSLMARVGMSSVLVVPLVRAGHAFGVVQVLSSSPYAFSEGDAATCAALGEVLAVIISASAEISRIVDRLGEAAAAAPAGGPAGDGPAGDGSTGSGSGGAVLARFVASVLRPAASARLEVRRRVLEVLDGRRFTMVYQPIVDLRSGATAGFEALARFDQAGLGPPDSVFADAAAVGLGVELELAAVERALTALGSIPEHLTLSVNVGPETLASDALVPVLDAGRGRRVAVELTEHAAVQDYKLLEGAIATLREHGVLLAIDDTGAGFASLAHIVKLAPDLVKLDRWIVEGVAADPVRRALVLALVGFAHELGARVVGEGIETRAELEALRDLGVELGQGYVLGRPGDLAGQVRNGT